MLDQLKELYNIPNTSGWIEILVLTMMFYSLFRLFKGTRGASILSGLVIVYGTLYLITTISHLDILNWLLSRLMIYLSLAFVVIFQPELRQGLARLGRPVWKSSGLSSQKDLVDPITEAAEFLSKRKIGALIAIEREIQTRDIQENAGTKIQAIVTPELLCTIFFPRCPLHDGGVIISGKKIATAGCLFPLSQKQKLSKSLGTRHRAAIGITEETDAIVVVVSEETGAISIAYNGRLRRGFTPERLHRVLSSMLRREHTGLARYREKLEEGEAHLSDTALSINEESNEESP